MPGKPVSDACCRTEETGMLRTQNVYEKCQQGVVCWGDIFGKKIEKVFKDTVLEEVGLTLKLLGREIAER